MSIQRSRRAVISAIGTGVTLGLAGCTGGETNDGGTTTGTADGGSPQSVTILVYSGAGLKKPMDAIAEEFEASTNTEVNYKYAGSNTLLSQIELNKQGDVYMPGAKLYIDQADQKGFVENRELVAYHTPTIIVPEGNPKGISALSDLTNSGVDVALGDPGAAAIGKMAKKILQQNDLYEDVQQNVVTEAGTTNELVVYITQKQADAAITWRADVHGLLDKTDRVTIAEEKNIIKTIPIGTLTFSEHPSKAQQFVDFVASEDGQGIFEDYGYVKYEDGT